MKRLLCIVCVLGLFLSGCASPEMKEARAQYTKQTNRIQKQEEALRAEIKVANTSLKKNNPPLDVSTKKDLVTTIASAKEGIQKIPSMPSSESDIKKKTKQLKKIDYTSTIQSIKDKVDAYKKSIKQYKQLTNPSQDFIVSRLKGISGITDIGYASEGHDINNNLNKQGGYTAQVFFAYDKVDQSQFSTSDVVDKGTDAGGSIEVYKTEKEAKQRDTYLGAFDGSMFASGSHRVVGTCIIRTSDELNASQQNELDQQIYDALSRLEG